MLVGHSQSGGRSLAAVDLVPPPVEFFPQALSPELLEPECEFPERLGIRKQNKDGLPELVVQYPLDECGNESGILGKLLSRLGRRGGCSAHQRFYVVPEQRCRKRANRRENAESSADIPRDFKHRKLFLTRD